VWDVGANVGAVSLLCARQGAARVLAFEPADANLVRLEEHRWANPGVASLIEVIPVAVSDADGETELLVGDAGAEAQIVGQGMHLWHDSKDGARAITVRTILLDSLLNDSRPGPAILKIDVEGAEELVLNGARRVLRQCRPAVVLEVHTVSAYRRCTEVLKQAGYNIRQIVGRRLRESGDEAIAYGHVLALHAEAGLKEGGRCHAC
jgi:FkbM family methyltransferase